VSKYRSIPQVVDGIRFASKAEARRYGELKLLERAGKIEALQLQPKFSLMVSNTKLGEYRADFAYFCKTQLRMVYEDVKGFRNPLFIWKKKHTEAQHLVTITEVRA